MKHFKNPTDGSVWAYELDGSQDALIPDSYILLEGDAIKEAQDAHGAAIFNAKAWDEKRIYNYPPVGDQLDALFHAGAFPAEMAAQIQAVKDAYPKS